MRVEREGQKVGKGVITNKQSEERGDKKRGGEARRGSRMERGDKVRIG